MSTLNDILSFMYKMDNGYNKAVNLNENSNLYHLLLTEDQEKTIKNKIANGITNIIKQTCPSDKIQQNLESVPALANELEYIYVQHPLHDNIHKRQNDEIWAINKIIDRLIPYVVRQNDDGSYYISRNSRIKQAFENLIQAQRKEQKSKKEVWGQDNSLTYWNTNKRYNEAIEAAKKQAGNRIEGKYHYSVYHIDSYDEPIEGLGMTVTELGKYTGGKGLFDSLPLCYTQHYNTYNDYTKNNRYDMYALLRDDWKEQTEKCQVDKETYPLDEYGLSMIFVIVNDIGTISTSNVRWNHGPRSERFGREVDNALTYNELVDIVGSNIMNQIGVNVDVDKSLLLTYSVEKRIKTIEDVRDLFERTRRTSNDGIICGKCQGKWNYIDVQRRELLSDEWFDYAGSFFNGCGAIEKDEKWNYLKRDGTLLWDKPFEEWFDSASSFMDGVGVVQYKGVYNIIKKDGELMFGENNPIATYSYIYGFENGFAEVEKDGKSNFIRLDGSLVYNYQDTKYWFDAVSEYGFNKFNQCVVKKNNHYNVLASNGKLLVDSTNTYMWFAYISNPVIALDSTIGYYRVKNAYGLLNYIRVDGSYVWDKPWHEWFEETGLFYPDEQRAIIKQDGKYNILRFNGTLVWDKPWHEWFDDVFVRGGQFFVEKKPFTYIISDDGKTLTRTLPRTIVYDDEEDEI